MKTIYLSSLCLLAALSFGLASCDDDSDNVKPVINLIEPEDDAVLQIGDDVHFEMELSDNEMLKSYKVDIHSNFDSHTHALSRADDAATTPFSFNRSWEVTGKNAHIHHHDIVVPEDATPGPYHLVVYCTDAAGNEAILSRDIELSHEGESHDDDHDDHDE